jgi:hypothetical protein
MALLQRGMPNAAKVLQKASLAQNSRLPSSQGLLDRKLVPIRTIGVMDALGKSARDPDDNNNNILEAQDRPESKQILAKLAGKNQHLRKANISEVGSLCSVKFMGCNMYRKKTHRWTE